MARQLGAPSTRTKPDRRHSTVSHWCENMQGRVRGIRLDCPFCADDQEANL